MHLTYLILAHQNPYQLIRLVKSLMTKNSSFVIHLDKRTDQDKFIPFFTSLDMEKVHFVKNRCVANWGTFGLVQATLNCLKFIHKKLSSCDRIIMLSGDDYPIKDTDYIYSYLNSNRDAIYMNYWKLPHKKWHNGGVSRYPYFEHMNQIMGLYGGSQWMSFPMYVVKIIFDFLKLNPDFIKYFKTVQIPDEGFFQTLLLNCEEDVIDQNLVNRGLHLIKWDFPYIHPRLFDIKSIKLIKRSRYLFARKFPSQIPCEILDKIDVEILNPPKRNTLKVERLNQDLSFNGHQDCFLFLTDKAHKDNLDYFKDFKETIGNPNETYIVFHKKRENITKKVAIHSPFIFDKNSISMLGFNQIYKKLVPGSNHFPLFQFYREHPNYKFYWYIEDDVRYNGKWNDFFTSISQEHNESDFLTCHLRKYSEEPQWHWWTTMHHVSGFNIPLAMRIRSFNPIFRISNSALAYLNYAFLNGWSGHHEVTIATLLHHGGFKINDFGGKGDFVLEGCQHRYYDAAVDNISGDVKSGSMRYRPIITKEEMTAPILYHPFKIQNK